MMSLCEAKRRHYSCGVCSDPVCQIGCTTTHHCRMSPVCVGNIVCVVLCICVGVLVCMSVYVLCGCECGYGCYTVEQLYSSFMVQLNPCTMLIPDLV